MNKRRLTSDETLPIMLSFAGAIGVLPLAIIRLRDGDWMIGIFDALLVVCMGALGLYVLRTQRVRVASVLLSIVCVIGVVTTIALKGPAQSFWAYPAVLAVFFLLSPREAVVAALTMIVGMAPVLVLNAPGITATSVLVTLLVTSAFAYAFSVLTNDQREQLFKLASHDPLTGAGNRRAFEERLDDIVARNQRQHLNASLLMLDLDHFKRINDEHGHDVGDDILVAVTSLIRERIRVTDKLYRIGGEEFVIVMDGDLDDTAARLAEELRTRIEQARMPSRCRVTASIGLAQLKKSESQREWLRRADEALYVAKNSGRNRVSIAA